MASSVAQIAKAMAGARNLEGAAVRDLIDRAPYRGSEAVQLGLVDRLGYWDEVEASVSAAADAPLENWLPLADYGSTLPAPDSTSPVIALVHGTGPIVQIGRASCRESVCQYVEIWVGAIDLKKKSIYITNIK